MTRISSAWRMHWLGLLTAVSVSLYLSYPDLIQEIAIPYEYYGDALTKLSFAQMYMEGDLHSSPRLSAPFGFSLAGFPKSDALTFVPLGLLAKLTGSAAVGLNVFYLLGFLALSLAAFWSLRRMGFGSGQAAAGAFIYTFLPSFHLRGTSHVQFAFAVLIPLACWITLAVANQDKEPPNKRAFAFSCAVAALLALQNIYYAAFLCVLVALATIRPVLATGAMRLVLWPVLVIVSCVVSFGIMRLSIRGAHEPSSAISRQAAETERYSLFPAQLVLPSQAHRVPALRAAAAVGNQSLAQSVVDPERIATSIYGWREQSTASLGLILAVTFILQLLSFARAKPMSDVSNNARWLAFAAVAYGVAGGLSALFSTFVFALLRAPNRVSVFLAFYVVVFLCDGLERLRRVRPKLSRWLTLGLCIGAFFDQSVAFDSARFSRVKARYLADRDYFKKLEALVPAHAAVFYYPTLSFPEAGAVNQMPEYDNLKPLLHTQTLRFSSITVRGSQADVWRADVMDGALPSLIKDLRVLGFSAILLDRLGITTPKEDLAELERLLGPPIVSDQRYSTFTLLPLPPIDPCPSRFEMTEGNSPMRYLSTGWARSEQWGTWSLDERATLSVPSCLPPMTPVIVDAVLQAFASDANTQEFAMQINAGDLSWHQFKDPELRTVRLQGEVDHSGKLGLAFFVTHPKSPRELGESIDTRRLGVGVKSITVYKAP